MADEDRAMGGASMKTRIHKRILAALDECGGGFRLVMGTRHIKLMSNDGRLVTVISRGRNRTNEPGRDIINKVAEIKRFARNYASREQTPLCSNEPAREPPGSKVNLHQFP
jgi:hypothetical protein